MSGPNDHPWWNREFAAGWRGILREAREAGLAQAEAETLARKLLDEAWRELSVAGEEMTVAMFRRRLVQATRREIAEALRGTRDAFNASTAWRERYHVVEPPVEDDTVSPEPVPDRVARSVSAAESTPGEQGQCSVSPWHVLGLVHVIGAVIKGLESQAWWVGGLVLILLAALVFWVVGQDGGSEGGQSPQRTKE